MRWCSFDQFGKRHFVASGTALDERRFTDTDVRPVGGPYRHFTPTMLPKLDPTTGESSRTLHRLLRYGRGETRAHPHESAFAIGAVSGALAPPVPPTASAVTACS